MQKYQQIINPLAIPQSEPLRPDQVPNAAGGYAWKADRWEQLQRFLLLGTIGGTYYTGERELTLQNLGAVDECIAEDGPRVVAQVAEVSKAGRALKNDPAIFVLAKVVVQGTPEARHLALEALPLVCRIPTHLFHFAEYHKALGGTWPRSLRTAVGRWYTGKTALQLAYHLTKYQNRDGWSNGDLLRLAHVTPPTPDHSWMFRQALGKDCDRPPDGLDDADVGRYYHALSAIAGADARTVARLIREARLPREVIPTELLNAPEIWDALLEEMPITAMIRNLGKLTSVGVIAPMQAGRVVAALSNAEQLRKGRVHPLAVLMAANVYGQGRGEKGSLTWTPNSHVLEALDRAFYTCFGNLVPTNRRLLLSLDISGSMQQQYVAGTAMTAARAGAAVMLVLAATEPNAWPTCFGTAFHEFPIHGRMSLAEVQNLASRFNEGTDCALPIMGALQANRVVDGFVIITDYETWAGKVHYQAALDEYRRRVNKDARVVLLTTTPNAWKLNAPGDRGALNVIGFDASALQAAQEYLR